MSSYKKPILVSVLQIIGVLNGVAAVATSLISFSQSPLGVMPGIMCVLGGIVAVTLFFGLAQCVDYLGRTAYHTERTADLLERQNQRPTSPAAKDDAWRRAQGGL
ncbi:hypothetical protein [Rariglobus hedericola]|uniref:Uncharacterized protein n=1 Tax=Rariglobus hedericola TaxID=2597822 RepID=A0A556QP93_9BACT|nr:hypothetical protein [Rariglobus hedericola]TSJ78463.1 hypothetical protein FPL22_03955 [Rariglobus hedericola]